MGHCATEPVFVNEVVLEIEGVAERHITQGVRARYWPSTSLEIPIEVSPRQK
jgi:hypothetical protein